MNSFLPMSETTAAPRFERLRQGSLLGGVAFARWKAATIGIIGGGNLGGRIVLEIVRTGAQAVVFDPDIGSEANVGTQVGIRPGVPKVVSLSDECERIAPGRARGVMADIRHVGVGELATLDLLIDASDDSSLAAPLTEISNGLDVPLLRVAVDGSGQMELGRILASAGGAGHSCQLCSYTLDDLFRHRSRTPCPGGTAEPPSATLASVPLSMAISGLCLMQAMRLLGGNGSALVLDHEIVMDLSNFQTLAIRLPRSANCLSGHVRWELHRLAVTAAELRFGDLFALASQRLQAPVETLEPYAHALWTEAVCGSCGVRQRLVGSTWFALPPCDHCNQSLTWRAASQQTHWSQGDAARHGILARSLVELGLPAAGAMIVARAQGHPPLRLLLR